MKTAIRVGALCAMMVTIASLTTAACGSDSGTGTSNDKSKSTGGQTGAGGAPAGSVGCGMNNCLPPEGSDLTPCCKDAFASLCGVLNGTTCADAPKPPPMGCPTLAPFMGITFAACCTMDGQCGIDLTMFGQGCVDIATALQMAQAMGQTITNPPAPASCTPGATM
jgi:hypothetical protein